MPRSEARDLAPAPEHPRYELVVDDGRRARLTADFPGRAPELSTLVPILGSLGFALTDHRSSRGRSSTQEYVLRRTGPLPVTPVDAPRVVDTVTACLRGACEVTPLNSLVTVAGLDWRQVSVLGACAAYHRHLFDAPSPSAVRRALVANPRAALLLWDLFAQRLDPARAPGGESEARAAFLAACDDVPDLVHDRTLRAVGGLVDATLRTNVFRTAGAFADEVPTVALKLDPSRIAGLPQPLPYREIYVHSPLLEGVHLRGAAVARGGVRCSDRHRDLRVEILDLLRAQLLKNAFIVPAGAKGGFRVRAAHRGPSREDPRADRYRRYVRALLDVTDNVVDGRVVPPAGVRRHDGDDAYLVIAPDKGTAELSDLANAVARDYGYWLDEAFAAGGSNGFDHRALGVTARGAWRVAQRHFRDLGLDPQVDPITTVGIGDLSGDVFGNAMLRSRTLRLVAAFDHRHVFVDPQPDAEASFRERERLQRLRGSTWMDYDPAVVSEGGAVYPRTAKRIRLSEAARRVLGAPDGELSAVELVQAILAAPVDLLFAGGVGTFVKATHETHADVGDRANDDVRIDAGRLRARVYVEGANLSITQAGRVEYARRGGRINRDAIDNGAGVATSDREVNLKILLGEAQRRGQVDAGERERLFRASTDAVVTAVLRDVGVQADGLSVEAARSAAEFAEHERLLRRLEGQRLSDRRRDGFPDDEELARRRAAGAGLTRPELATLLCLAKAALADALVHGRFAEHPATAPVAVSYFPPEPARRFGDLVGDHPLRREIVCTTVANEIVDRLGICLPFRLEREHAVSLSRVAAAYWAARSLADAPALWEALSALDDATQAECRVELAGATTALLERLTVRHLRDVNADPLTSSAHHIAVRDALRPRLGEIGGPAARRAFDSRRTRLRAQTGNAELASTLAAAPYLDAVPAIAAVHARMERTGSRRPAVVRVADVHLRLGDTLGLAAMESLADTLRPESTWGQLHCAELRTQLLRLWRRATLAVLAEGLEPFLAERRDRLRAAQEVVRAVAGDPDAGADGLAVATRALAEACDGPAGQAQDDMW